jgi:hypothetical protein
MNKTIFWVITLIMVSSAQASNQTSDKNSVNQTPNKSMFQESKDGLINLGKLALGDLNFRSQAGAFIKTFLLTTIVDTIAVTNKQGFVNNYPYARGAIQKTCHLTHAADIAKTSSNALVRGVSYILATCYISPLIRAQLGIGV